MARRIPDGYVSGHANQARIRTFPRDDPANCRFAADVVDFAVAHGLYPASAPVEVRVMTPAAGPTDARLCCNASPTPAILGATLSVCPVAARASRPTPPRLVAVTRRARLPTPAPPPHHPQDFSFSDIYDPISFTGARLAEARVWNMFRQVADTTGEFERRWLPYVSGLNLTERMPLWVKPYRKISLNDTMWFMRAHYEGSAFDMTNEAGNDLGAGAWNAGWRIRPLYWVDKVKGQQYHNERPIGTQQTAWHFVSQMRSWMPREISTINWFSVDDTSHSLHVPVYSSATRISPAWADAGIQHVDDEGASLHTDVTKAFWAFNVVANFVYARWQMVNPVVNANITATEAQYFEDVKRVDATAGAMIKAGNLSGAVEYVTAFGEATGTAAVEGWFQLWQRLFFTFRDGFVVTPQPKAHPKDWPWPHVIQGGYDDAWYTKVAAATGDRYAVPATHGQAAGDEYKLRIPGL